MSSARISTTNSTTVNLLPNQAFNGTKDIVGEYTKCGVSVFADQEIYLLVTQSQNGVNADKLDVYTIPASTAPPPFTEFASPRISVEMAHKYVTITARNTSPTTATTFCRIETQVYNEGFLTHTHDSVKLFGTTADGTHKAVLTNADGALIVSGGGGGDASQWATFPAVSNVDGDGYDINNVTNISADGYIATNNLQSRSGGITNILIGNTLDMNDKNIIGANTVMTQTLTAPNETGLLITSPYLVSLHADNGVSISTPPLSGKEPYTMSYSNLGNLSFSLGEQNINNLLGVTNSQGFSLTQNGGGKIVFPDLTEQTTAYTGGGGGGGNFSTPSAVDLDMNTHKIIGITELTGVGTDAIIVNNDITFTGDAVYHGSANINNVSYINGNADDHLTLTNVGQISSGEVTNSILMNTENVQIGQKLYFLNDATTQNTAYQNPFQVDLNMNSHKITGITELTGVEPNGDPIIINNDITFSGDPEFHGGANINNVSYINGNADNYLTMSNVATINGADGELLLIANKVTLSNHLKFNEDATEQITAYQNPFQADLDMNGHKITGVTQLDTGENVSLWIESSPSTNNGNVDIFNNYQLIGANTTPASEIYLENDRIEINVFPSGYDSPAKSCFFEGTGLLTVPSLAITDIAGIDMNGNPIIQAPEIQSNLSMVITAGFTDTEEASTLSLSNNGYAVAGNYSELFLRPTGIELTTGNITDSISKSATFDTAGVFTAPYFALPSLGGGSITFPDSSTQITAYTGADIQNITSIDGSITITYPVLPNTVNLAVTSPYSLPVATTSVLGGVKTDGTTITATVDGVISATSQGITSNTFYVNDNVNTINDVLPLMGIGDIAIVSAGSFGNTTDITWNKAQTGLSGSVAPIPLTFLTTANASRFTVTATQVRIANIKFQLPVFLSGNNTTLDNCDFDSALTIGTNVTGYIAITNAEFVGTQTITVANTFANVCYFINCDFAGSTFALNQSSASQVIFNNCAGFTTYPANATYVGINTLTAGTAQLSTNTIKSVAEGQKITLASDIDANGASIIEVYQMKAYEYYGTPASGGVINMGGNINLIGHTIYNGLNITSDNLTLREGNGGTITYQDLTTQSSGVQKGSGTLTGIGGSPQGSYFITDTRVTAGCICVATYADSPPTGGTLSAIVTAGSGILIQSHLLADTSPIFYMYFI